MSRYSQTFDWYSIYTHTNIQVKCVFGHNKHTERERERERERQREREREKRGRKEGQKKMFSGSILVESVLNGIVPPPFCRHALYVSVTYAPGVERGREEARGRT